MKIKCISVILVVMVVILSSCSPKTVKIGFVGDMTSKQSQLAVDIRNAVEYGLNQVNEDGGVKGHQLELIIKDDGNDIEQAIASHEAFEEEGVQFIIGHVTSNMAGAVIYSESEEMLFFSPTMSTETLTGIDDFFVRTSPINSNQAKTLVDYIQKVGIEEVAVVYDLMNAEYTENLYLTMVELSLEGGVNITEGLSYDSRVDDLQFVGEQILATGTKDVIFLSQATDTAFFMQYLKQRDKAYVGMSVSWSMTQDLMVNGGENVQDMMFVSVFEPEVETEHYAAFAQGFESTYGYEPSFASVLGYDCAMALVEGMKASDSLNPVDVKEAIIEIRDFEGLLEVFDIDAYGDNSRQYLMYQLIDDTFVPQWD